MELLPATPARMARAAAIKASQSMPCLIFGFGHFEGRACQGRHPLHADLRPELVKKYLGTVVPISDNSFATLQLGGVLRRIVHLCAAGRALPDGAVDLFPHQ